MSYRQSLFSLAILTLTSAMMVVPIRAAEGDLRPSEAVTLMDRSMRYQPTAERTSITQPLVARMRTSDLDEMERFFKAEAHFLNFEPEPARDDFWEFRSRNDLLGRVAAQRLMIIRINAFEMVTETLEKDVPEYRKRFPVRSFDRHGISYPIAQAAQLLITQGKVDDALNLVVEEVRAHDRFDSAYSAYRLPARFLETAREHGRAEEFLALHQWAVDGLSSAIERRLENDPPATRTVELLPGPVRGSLFDDSELDHYQWTAEMRKLRDRLAASVNP